MTYYDVNVCENNRQHTSHGKLSVCSRVLLAVYSSLAFFLSLHLQCFVSTKGQNMRRKIGQSTFPNIYFKDGVLSIPGYTFEKVRFATLHDLFLTIESLLVV